MILSPVISGAQEAGDQAMFTSVAGSGTKILTIPDIHEIPKFLCIAHRGTEAANMISMFRYDPEGFVGASTTAYVMNSSGALASQSSMNVNVSVSDSGLVVDFGYYSAAIAWSSSLYGVIAVM